MLSIFLQKKNFISFIQVDFPHNNIKNIHGWDSIIIEIKMYIFYLYSDR